MRGITLNKSTQAVVYVITLNSCIHKQCSVCWFMPPRLEIKDVIILVVLFSIYQRAFHHVAISKRKNIAISDMG